MSGVEMVGIPFVCYICGSRTVVYHATEIVDGERTVTTECVTTRECAECECERAHVVMYTLDEMEGDSLL